MVQGVSTKQIGTGMSAIDYEIEKNRSSVNDKRKDSSVILPFIGNNSNNHRKSIEPYTLSSISHDESDQYHSIPSATYNNKKSLSKS